MDIAEFLQDRLRDDEAKVEGMKREMTRAQTAPIFAPHRDQMLGYLAGIDIFVSPDRLLAEIEAKRKILAIHSNDAGVCEACVNVDAWSMMTDSPDSLPQLPYPCPTLRLLAEPFSGHAGYNEAWRP